LTPLSDSLASPSAAARPTWSGIFHILATPFRQDGALDAEGLPRLIECALATGVNGLTILGIAGEAHRLTDEERRRVVETVVKETRGRVPVTTQVNMPAPFIAQLCAEIPLVAAVKLEEPPTLPKITRLRALFGTRVAIFGGLGGVYFFEELSRGADGAMTGFPYPEALRTIREHFAAGRREEARALFYRWLPLIRYESQPGATPGTAVGIRKEILRRRGWIATALVRPPAPVLDAATYAELSEILAALAS
jgi:dihydrodipicolinate synthase/N-acetylneuraminate lyase